MLFFSDTSYLFFTHSMFYQNWGKNLWNMIKYAENLKTKCLEASGSLSFPRCGRWNDGRKLYVLHKEETFTELPLMHFTFHFCFICWVMYRREDCLACKFLWWIFGVWNIFKWLKAVEPETILSKTGLAYPHTAHSLASGGILISCLGDKNGNAEGNEFVLLDWDLNVKGQWEKTGDSLKFGYDFWYPSYQDGNKRALTTGGSPMCLDKAEQTQARILKR